MRQGTGVGRALLERAERDARGAGFLTLDHMPRRLTLGGPSCRRERPRWTGAPIPAGRGRSPRARTICRRYLWAAHGLVASIASTRARRTARSPRAWSTRSTPSPTLLASATLAQLELAAGAQQGVSVLRRPH
jgi:hypothetical protein